MSSMLNENSESVHEHQPGCCGIFCGVVKLCGLCCFLCCPPVPELITRKLAFHPPAKDSSYSLQIKEEPDKPLKSVKDAQGRDFIIVPNVVSPATSSGYEEVLKYVETFTVRTAFRNHLVAIKCSPQHPSRNKKLKEQVILFAQPNSSDVGGFLNPLCMNFSQMAELFEMDVYGFDYSGYGYSTGSPSEKNIYADIDAMYQYVRETAPNKKIVLLGYSLGTSVVVQLASTRPTNLAGVVLVAPFSSGLRLFQNDPTREKACCLDRFTSVDKIHAIDVPVLICHGTENQVIPHDHALALHRRLSHPVTPLIVYGANHQTILNGSAPQTFSRIYRFLRLETKLEEGSESAENK